MKKYNFVGRLNKNDGDCSIDTLSIAIGMEYDEFMDIVKPFIHDNGGLNTYLIKGILYDNGFESFGISNTDVRFALNMYDTINNQVVMLLNKESEHIFYVQGNNIFDFEMYDNKSLLEHQVVEVFMKPLRSDLIE